MAKIKSHRSVEQIAKKHRIDVSFVQKQLKMGIAIEHEHTKDKDLATDIALQHLDEIPDYYTRLKKMEKSAKRSHDKKYKDVVEEKRGLWANIHAKRERGERPAKKGEKGYPKTLNIDEGIKQARKNVGASKCWSGKKLGSPRTKMKNGREVPNCVPIKEAAAIRYCPKCDKNEARDECKYGERYWDMFSRPITLGKKYTPNTPHPGNMPESYDHEHSMARSELATIASAVKKLRKKMKGEGNIEAWVQSKITKAADYLDSAADYVDSGEMKEQMLPPIDPEEHKRSQRNQKIYNKGKSTDNPHERDTFLKRTGPQLPFVKRKTATQVAHYEYDGDYIQEDAAQDKFDRRVNAAMSTENPTTRIKLLKQAASIHPSKLKTFEQFIFEASKSSMACNKPKAEAHGSGESGKSHVVKACSKGKETLIRFGQLGVKGSPKKKGESKKYASRRHRFQSRHSKNIAKGPMSAAYWSNKVKW